MLNLIATTERNQYAIITINRAPQMNLLSQAVFAELTATLTRLRTNRHLRAIVLTGANGIFSVGADLNEVAQLDPVTAFEFSRRGQATLKRLSSASTARVVTIAAIDGYCLGGGLDLALACELRFASPRSTFAHPGAKRGIITGWGGTIRLPRLVGRTTALQLFLTGDRIDAAEALRIGLVHELCDNVLARACMYAESLPAIS